MEISKDIHLFWKDIFKISYENYKKELETFKYVSVKTFEDYTRYLNENIDGINGLFGRWRVHRFPIVSCLGGERREALCHSGMGIWFDRSG